MAKPKGGGRDGLAWKLVAAGAAMAATALARKATEAAWRRAARREPPTSPKHPDSKWAEALAFAALTGAVAGAAKLVATRKAAASWRSVTGVLPPGLDELT